MFLCPVNNKKNLHKKKCKIVNHMKNEQHSLQVTRRIYNLCIQMLKSQHVQINNRIKRKIWNKSVNWLTSHRLIKDAVKALWHFQCLVQETGLIFLLINDLFNTPLDISNDATFLKLPGNGIVHHFKELLWFTFQHRTGRHDWCSFMSKSV